MCQHLPVVLYAEVDPTYLLPIVLYTWLAVSITVYAVRWRKRKAAAEAEGGDAGTAPAKPSPGTGPDAPVRAAARAAATPRVAPTTTSPPAGGSSGSMVEAVIREEIEARKRAEAGDDPAALPTPEEPAAAPSAGRSGLFAPTHAAVAPEAPRVTVAEALSGIDWPCDLAPLVTGAPDPYRVAFVTRGVPAEEVGAALGDELERLGFTLASVNDTTAKATRDGTEVQVVIHPDGSRVLRGGERAFPTANAASVVVEFST